MIEEPPSMVRVKMYGIFRKISGHETVEVQLDEERVPFRTFLRRLIGSLPPNFEEVLMDAELGDPRPNAILLINGKDISLLKGLDTAISDNDEIVLLPITHGG